MHILFLTDNFPPESNAPASRTFEHAREWVLEGHQVTVITCAPNFPKGSVFDGYKNLPWQSEVIEGIRVIRVWTFISANKGFLLRTIDYQSFMLSAIIASLFVKKPDVIVGTSPQFFTVIAAWVSARLKRRPWVFELRDIWPESIRTVGAMKTSKVLDFLEKIELFLYKRATMIVSVTHSFKTYLKSRGVDTDKVTVITNGVDTRHFKPMVKDLACLEALGLKEKFVAGYIGTHGMAHALEVLLEAAKILQDTSGADDIRILLVGDGAHREALVQKAQSMKLQNVVFKASVPKSEVKNYWSILDIAIIHLRKSDLFKSVIPSKMFECMGMGIPILHGVAGESADILDAMDAGETFEPENARELAEKILKLRLDSMTRARYAKNGVERVNQYDRRELARNMLDVLIKTADRKSL